MNVQYVTQAHLKNKYEVKLKQYHIISLFLAQCQWMLKMLEELQRTEERPPLRLKVKLLLLRG